MNNETENKPVDLNRRRLAKTGLATPIVLATLASKNALANPAYRCTISGQLSNNFSPAGHGSETDTCSFSTTPTSLAPQNSNWGSANKNRNFKGFFSLSNSNVYGKLNNSLVARSTLGASDATLNDVITKTPSTTSPPANPELGQWCIAALVSRNIYGTDYPLTNQQIKEMFDATINGGNYIYKTNVYLNASDVINYLKFLSGVITAPPRPFDPAQ
jgi:hypothetical protein